MTSACNSEVKRSTDACESEAQKTEIHADPVHKQDLCCSVLRGQVRMIQFVHEDRGVSNDTTH